MGIQVMFIKSATRATRLSIWGVYAHTHTLEMETAVAAVAGMNIYVLSGY